MNELARLLKEADEGGRWITTKSGHRIFLSADKLRNTFDKKFSQIRIEQGKEEELKAKLSDDDHEIRWDAMSEIAYKEKTGEINSKFANEMAIKHIDDADNMVRRYASEIIEKNRPIEALEPILKSVIKNKKLDSGRKDDLLKLALLVNNPEHNIEFSYNKKI